MVGRKALSLLTVAAVALIAAMPASAQTRAPDSQLAGLVFPTQSRDWSSDPGGFKAASLDLAAALTGKACGADEFHVWTIADFAAGVRISESVDEAFRSAGWTLDLVSRDSELSRIWLAKRGEQALILNWMPEEGVVGLLMCVAAEPGSVPERVADAAPLRGFSLDPTMPPLPRPAPRGEGGIIVADAGAGLPAKAGAVDPSAATNGGAAVVAAADVLPGPANSPPATSPGPATAAVDGGTSPSIPAGPPAVLTAQAPATEPPTGAELPAPGMPLAAPSVNTATTALAANESTAQALDTPSTLPATGAATGIAGPSPTRTPIDLGMTAAITEPAPAEPALAAPPASPAMGPPTAESISAMYERVPPPPSLINPQSVAEHSAGPIVRPQATSPSPIAPPARAAQVSPAPTATTSAGTQVSPRAAFEGEAVPVTTVIAPAVESRGPVWPLFLLAVILAGAALVILMRRQAPRRNENLSLWPTALASVVGAELDERVGNEGIQFTPVLRYRFAIGENEFEATTEGWGGRPLATRSAAEAVLANFPEHARVELSYDPTDPTRVALPEPERPADPMQMVAAACLALAALTLVLTLV